MLHRHVTKLDVEKLADMKTADLEGYLNEIGARLRHLHAVTAEALELEGAIGREIAARKFSREALAAEATLFDEIVREFDQL